ncbi:MAG: methionyl-tRNA formyltransferase [Clostridia bacterium]|nr:methionyl-tRNA formyltransferase [Clostridia bacterium]
MKILFMGTPDFAVCSLAALYDNGQYELTVITQPDKPKGRGYVLTPPEVKVYAEEHGLKVYQPNTLRDEAFFELLSEIDPDMIVVAAYGKILPKNVIDYPKYGCINVHGSLLPEYRGAAPIQRAIIDGKTETGVTIMYMNEGLDTGDMLKKASVQIKQDDNFETLFDKLASAGAELLVKTIPEIVSGAIVPEKQDDSLATYAKKIEKSDCIIDFSCSAKVVHNQIRGLSPFPLASANIGGLLIKPITSVISKEKSDKPFGTIVSLDGKITVSCGDGGCIDILELLPAGKKRMKAADFLRGSKLSVGDKFD